MAPCTPRLKQTLLAVLIAMGPLYAAAQALPQGEKLEVSRSAPVPLEANDPLLLWFKEQDRVLDDILLRLARIEALVREIHRLVTQLPNVPQGVATTQNLPRPASVPQSVPPSEQDGFDPGSWLGYAAVAALLGLLSIVAKRRRPAPKAPANLKMAAAQMDHSVPPASTSGVAHQKPEQAKQSPSTHRPVADDGQSDQALELAEIMLSMGLGHGAAQTLVEQIAQEPKQALRHWLKLLAIYRQNGQRDEFEQSAEELRLHFNVRPEDWHAAPEAQTSLEDYPHIAAQLTQTWRKAGCLTYVQELLSDNRGGARSGFPQAVAEELLLLAAMLKAGNQA